VPKVNPTPIPNKVRTKILQCLALFPGKQFLLCVWVVQTDKSRNKFTLRIPHTAKPNDVIAETIRWRSRKMGRNKEETERAIEGYSHTYVLKVCGCDLFLFEGYPMSQYKVHAEDVECFVYNLEKLFGLTKGVIVRANLFFRKSGQASFQLTYRHPVCWTIWIGPIRRLKLVYHWLHASAMFVAKCFYGICWSNGCHLKHSFDPLIPNSNYLMPPSCLQYIRECLETGKIPQLMLLTKENVYTTIRDAPFVTPSYVQRGTTTYMLSIKIIQLVLWIQTLGTPSGQRGVSFNVLSKCVMYTHIRDALLSCPHTFRGEWAFICCLYACRVMYTN